MNKNIFSVITFNGDYYVYTVTHKDSKVYVNWEMIKW